MATFFEADDVLSKIVVRPQYVRCFIGDSDMPVSRRRFLQGCGAALATAAAGVPILLRAQTPDLLPDQTIFDASDPKLPQLASDSGEYVIPFASAPRPFSHVLVRLELEGFAAASTRLYLATSVDGLTLGDWQELVFDEDLSQFETDSGVLYSGITPVMPGSRAFQVRVVFAPNADGNVPRVRRLAVNTVDVGADPLLPKLAAVSPSALGRPGVVSRAGWGCGDGQGTRRPPDYLRVRHLIVHHTAGSNALGPGETWAGRVRAIWSYHTITQRWGDIGYNYLIAPDGTIFEGRSGGDDAVGFHDTANYGSMGVSIMGTYGSYAPPAAAQESLVRLLAWKAQQRGIDPFASAYYAGCEGSSVCTAYTPNAVIATIAGHRQVTPVRTSCPGDAFAALLPQIRQRVAATIAANPAPTPAPLTPAVELRAVRFDRVALAAGELLRASFVVRNISQETLRGQAPRAAGDPADDGYVYDYDQCFLGDVAGTQPGFPKESGAFRVALGVIGWDVAHTSSAAGLTSDYPWRWGLNADLAPGQEQTLVGYVRVANPGDLTLRAAVVEEWVRYHVQDVLAATVAVVPVAPQSADLARYDNRLSALAQVSRLPAVPRNLLARLDAPFALAPEGIQGTVPWSGAEQSWGQQGPAGVGGAWLLDQTRAYIAPVDGIYTFRVSGSARTWLWSDGLLVAGAASGTSTADVALQAGVHALSFRALAASSDASCGYALRLPDASEFAAPRDAYTDAAPRDGSIFTAPVAPAFASAERGSGIQRVQWSLDGVEWTDGAGLAALPGTFEPGSYTVRYRAINGAGVAEPAQQVTFRVDPTFQRDRVLLPVIQN